MNKQKKLWEALAKKDSMHYIFAKRGKLTAEDFSNSGFQDYQRLIADDDLITTKAEFDKATILDLGCGIGRMTGFMPAYFKRVIGVDISGEMIKQAKERMKGSYGIDRIELIETDGKSLPLMNDSVDIVFSYLVFQHIKTRRMVKSNFKEVYRVLKSGGLFKVLLRTNKQNSMRSWWSGVHYDKKSATIMSHNVGFYVIKTELVGNYGLWLWLVKGY